MRILLTTLLFLPENYTGTEVMTHATAKELQRLGHDVHVLTGFDGREDLADTQRFDEYVYDGLPVSRFHYARVPMGGESDPLEMEYNNRFVAAWFRELLQALKPDVVHAFHLSRLSASLIDVCDDLGTPVVVTATDFWFVCPLQLLLLPDNSCCHGPDRFSVNCMRHLDALNKPGEATIVKRFPDILLAVVAILCRTGLLPRKRFRFPYAMALRPKFLMQRLNRVAKVIIPSRIMESVLVDHGLNRKQVIFSGFGLNLDTIPEPGLRDYSGRLRVGFIGSLYEHKGIEVFLRAVRGLPAELSLEIKIYGENKGQPEYLQSLHDLAGDDPRIRFLGAFPNREIGAVLAGIDVLVVPSIWYENTPLIIYSAMAAGCPVIASDFGGMSEVVQHEVNGLLVAPGNVAALAQAVRRLVDDRELLARLASHCKRPKSIGTYVEELLSIYRDVCQPVRDLAG